jgi:predicted nicotinamide N-methyase
MPREGHDVLALQSLDELDRRLGPLVEEPVVVEGHTFRIYRPDEAKSPVARGGQQYQAFWAELWPAARMLAKAVVQEPWPPGAEAVEIGCGLGLPGIAALARGLRVLFSDYDVTALSFAAANARLNGFEDFGVRRLDWNDPPADWRVPVLLASDLIYELVNVAPLVQLLKQMLLPGGVCLMTDQDRVPSFLLRETLEGSGLAFTTRTMRAGQPGGRRFRGSLYRITHAAGTA